jgi:zinc protease
VVRVYLRVGNIDENSREVWMADLTGEMLKEGTSTLSATDIAKKAAGYGGQVNVSTGLDRSWVGGEVLSDFTPDMVKLLADIIKNPAFPEKEFERIKKDYLRNLSIAKAEPQNLAREKFVDVLYDDHPYGRMFPTEDMLKNYTVDEVRNFYKNNYGAVRAHIYIVGKFNSDEVAESIRSSFSDWLHGPEPVEKTPQPESERKIYLINRPGAPQSTIYMGLPVIGPTNPDYMPLVVTNALLGGFFSSRVTANIREDKGYTYSPRSSVNTHYHDAYWLQVADVSTNVTGASLKEIFYEIDRLQNEAPEETELRGVQNYLAGRFNLSNSSRNGIVNQLAFINLQGLGRTYLTDYIKNIYTVTPQQVQEMTQKYIRDGNMTIVIVGDKKEVTPQVKRFAPIVN